MKFKNLLPATLCLLFTCTCLQIKSQTYQSISGRNGQNTINTSVPFLLIKPDARSGAMGDIGVSSKPDVFSMAHNPAKYAFIKDLVVPSEDSLIRAGNYKLMQGETRFGFSYSPWLPELAQDGNLGYIAFAKPLNLKSTFASTLRFFSLGNIQFTDINGNDQGTYRPNEFAFDATIAQKLSKNLSAAIAGRFIYSNLTLGQNVGGASTSAGLSVAVDIALYFEKDISWFDNMAATLAWGINISNIGNKIGYSQASIKKDFLPTNLGLGPTLSIEIDDYHEISFSMDINKLLVPTPPVYLRDSITGQPILIPGTDRFEIFAGMDNDVSVVQGILQSFYDAPDGFREEMRELSFSFGAEYWYQNTFSLRGGAFYEDAKKGNRKFATAGVGFRYKSLGLDLSYLVPLNSDNNVLKNTFRFSLYLNLLGKMKITPDVHTSANL